MSTIKCKAIRAACYLGRTLTGAIAIAIFFGIIYLVSMLIESIPYIVFPNIVIPEIVSTIVAYIFISIVGFSVIYAILMIFYAIGRTIFETLGISFCHRRE